MRITDAKARRKKLTELYIDGEPAVKIATEIWERSSYGTDCEISDEELWELLEESERYRAKEKALYLLEYRQHSKKELEDKISRTLPRGRAKEAVEKMEELGLTDDTRFAKEQARYLTERKGYAPKRVLFELAQKGIDRETAQAALDELEVDTDEMIQRILRKKYPDLTDEKTRARAIRGLQSLGYSFGQIREAIKDTETFDF